MSRTRIPNGLGWVYRLSLPARVFLILFLCAAVPTILLGVGSTLSAGRLLRSAAITQQLRDNTHRAQLLDTELRQVVVNFNRLLDNPDFVNALRFGIIPAVSSGSGTAFDYVEPFLYNFRKSHRLVESVSIHTERMIYYDTSRHVNFVSTESRSESMFEQYLDVLRSRSIAWGVPVDPSWQADPMSTESPAIVFVPYLGSIPDRRLVVVIVLSDRTLRRYLSSEFGQGSGSAYIVNEDGAVLESTGATEETDTLLERDLVSGVAEDPSGAFSRRLGGSTYHGVYATVGVSNWNLITVVPRSSYSRYLSRIPVLTILLTGFGMALAIGLAVTVSRRITIPLQELHDVATRVRHGELNVRFQGTGRGELGEFGRTLNLSLDEMERLISELEVERDNVQSERQLKLAAELKALQAQVNPHFLYNTLNCIYWKSMLSGGEEVANLSLALSRFFRVGLNNGAEEVTVGHEIDLVTTYLDIQKTVYPDVFVYDVDVPATIMDKPILKFTLQPLVENAIIHGFRDRETGGVLRISGAHVPGAVSLTVEDNGCGFEPADIQAHLNDAHTGGEDGHGYALGNVYQRLRLFFGEQVDFSFSSTPFESNRVVIVMPDIPVRSWVN